MIKDGCSLSSVLVVEDNPDHRMLAERALRGAGLVVHAATSGEEALTKLDDADLVLVDFGLPKMTGIELLATIRERQGPPVVMITGMGTEKTAVQALKGGAVDYILKTPGFLTSLPQAVERAWRTHDLARRADELQRIALLVASASERDEILPEIARGARELLGADICGVLVADDSGVSLEVVDGEGDLDAALIQEIVAKGIRTDGVEANGSPTDRLLVPLPGPEGKALGLLVLVSVRARTYAPEEIELARTFASFAGMALTNVTRWELERSLVTQLQHMLDLRTKLVGSVSHELRTPLTSIAGFSQVLLDDWKSFTEEERKEFVLKVCDSAGELTSLVDGLLDFAAMESGHVEADLGPIELTVCVRTTLEALEPLLRERKVEFSGEPVMVLGDPVLIRRTLGNLVSNAVKYTEPGSPITIRVVRAEESVRVEVTDRGRGMTAEEAERVFEPFWRGGGGVRTIRGAGIGLSLVREYVRLMAGTVGVTSEPSRGSTFFFDLPMVDHLAALSRVS